VGEEFSKNFFLQHSSAGDQKVVLQVAGLAGTAAGNETAHSLLRELRSLRQVLDARALPEAGRYELRLAHGNPSDLLEAAVLAPLNAKLGQACFLLAGATGNVVNVRLTEACAPDMVRARLESEPPAGTLALPAARSKGGAKPASI
jgi:hypothetical protein